MYFIIVVFLVVIIIIVYVSYLTPTHTREPILLCTLVCVCERVREESAVRERERWRECYIVVFLAMPFGFNQLMFDSQSFSYRRSIKTSELFSALIVVVVVLLVVVFVTRAVS